MSFEKAQMTRIPIWAQFYNAPLEYWTTIGHSYIATSIGKPLMLIYLLNLVKR